MTLLKRFAVTAFFLLLLLVPFASASAQPYGYRRHYYRRHYYHHRPYYYHRRYYRRHYYHRY